MDRAAALVLAAYLGLWVPLRTASVIAASLPSLDLRGAPGFAEVVVRALAAALSLAAAAGLVPGNRSAVALATFAVLANVIVGVAVIYWTRLPGSLAPGQHLPFATAQVVWAAGWLLYLRRRARLSR